MDKLPFSLRLGSLSFKLSNPPSTSHSSDPSQPSLPGPSENDRPQISQNTGRRIATGAMGNSSPSASSQASGSLANAQIPGSDTLENQLKGMFGAYMTIKLTELLEHQTAYQLCTEHKFVDEEVIKELRFGAFIQAMFKTPNFSPASRCDPELLEEAKKKLRDEDKTKKILYTAAYFGINNALDFQELCDFAIAQKFRAGDHIEEIYKNDQSGLLEHMCKYYIERGATVEQVKKIYGITDRQMIESLEKEAEKVWKKSLS